MYFRTEAAPGQRRLPSEHKQCKEGLRSRLKHRFKSKKSSCQLSARKRHGKLLIRFRVMQRHPVPGVASIFLPDSLGTGPRLKALLQTLSKQFHS